MCGRGRGNTMFRIRKVKKFGQTTLMGEGGNRNYYVPSKEKSGISIILHLFGGGRRETTKFLIRKNKKNSLKLH